jgi:hypothetical protein
MILVEILLIPFVLLAAAAGGFYWLAYAFWFGANAQDRARAKHFFGWTDPAMDVHWNRLYSNWHVYENLKNLASEWTRSDPQRAVKLGMAGLILLLLISLVVH